MRNVLTTTIALLALSELALGSSLWHSKSNTEAGMFADRTARNIGDIVTVVVDESISLSTAVSKTTSSGGSAEADIINYFYAGSGGSSDILTHNGENPDLNINSNRSYTGNGNVSKTQSISSRVAVVVVDRLPNGNLIIEGARQVFVSGERQYAVLRGIVRREDIGTDNTINSSLIAHANVEFLDQGALADSQKKSWLMKLLDKVNVW